MKSLELFLYSTLYFCFPTSQRNAKMYEETSILYNWRIQVLFLSPLFLPSFYIFSFFCLSPFSSVFPYSDLFIYFCAWLRLAFLLFIFLSQPSCVFFFAVQKTAHLLLKLQTDRNAFITLRYSSECLTVIKQYRKLFFGVLLTVHFSIFISAINQLDAQNFPFTISFISCLYKFRAHVLIIRRSKLHYIASGIITPIGLMIHLIIINKL